MNTHTDAEIPKGREKEKRNERKKHIINLKNHEYKMPRSKKESKYQIIKTHRLQIPSWRNIQKKKKNQNQEPCHRYQKSQKYKTTSNEKRRRRKAAKSEDYTIEPKNHKQKNLERRKKRKKEQDPRIMSPTSNVVNIKIFKGKWTKKNPRPKTVSPTVSQQSQIQEILNETKVRRTKRRKTRNHITVAKLRSTRSNSDPWNLSSKGLLSSTTNSRRHMCVYSLERTPNETRLRPKRRCIATLFRRRQRLPAGFVHETAGSSIYRYRERDGSTWSEGGYCRSWKGCQWSMVCRWWTVRCNHVIHTFSHGSSLTHCQSPLPPCTLSAFSF